MVWHQLEYLESPEPIEALLGGGELDRRARRQRRGQRRRQQGFAFKR